LATVSQTKRRFHDVVFDEFSGDLIIRIGFIESFDDDVVAIIIFSDLYGWLIIFSITVDDGCISFFIILYKVINIFSFLCNADNE
jgi:hypothetical protein